MRSQVMKLAHAIRKQNQFLTWGQCQRQAWKVARLVAAMRSEEVSFTYQKQNGEIRQALGTLDQSRINYTRKGSGKPSPITVVKYFDCEKGAYRSFRAERILEGVAA